MFFHGFENYLQYAFPEDELRALTCGPLVRDEKNPENNDVLGNYSLTLIDSLSTLAILSSSPDSGERALAHFQDGVEGFVRLYGDGSDGPAGQGERSRGFDLDSKVQLFETVIRGLGMRSSPSGLIDLSLLDFRLLCPTANVYGYCRWITQCPSFRHRRATHHRLQAIRTGSCLRQCMG
jgi:hypothetical protein